MDYKLFLITSITFYSNMCIIYTFCVLCVFKTDMLKNINMHSSPRKLLMTGAEI